MKRTEVDALAQRATRLARVCSEPPYSLTPAELATITARIRGAESPRALELVAQVLDLAVAFAKLDARKETIQVLQVLVAAAPARLDDDDDDEPDHVTRAAIDRTLEAYYGTGLERL